MDGDQKEEPISPVLTPAEQAKLTAGKERMIRQEYTEDVPPYPEAAETISQAEAYLKSIQLNHEATPANEDLKSLQIVQEAEAYLRTLRPNQSTPEAISPKSKSAKEQKYELLESQMRDLYTKIKNKIRLDTLASVSHKEAYPGYTTSFQRHITVDEGELILELIISQTAEEENSLIITYEKVFSGEPTKQKWTAKIWSNGEADLTKTHMLESSENIPYEYHKLRKIKAYRRLDKRAPKTIDEFQNLAEAYLSNKAA